MEALWVAEFDYVPGDRNRRSCVRFAPQREHFPARASARVPTPRLVGPQTSARRNDEWKRLRVPDPAAPAERVTTGNVT